MFESEIRAATANAGCCISVLDADWLKPNAGIVFLSPIWLNGKV